MRPASSAPADGPTIPALAGPRFGMGSVAPDGAKPAPPGAIFATLRKCIAMMPVAMRWKWALLAPVSVLIGIIEAGAAAAVFALLKIINDPAQMTRIPI